jgi:nuclear transport factor 2 (NTF2) superfamily protein
MKKKIKSTTIQRINTPATGSAEPSRTSKGYTYSHSNYTADGQLIAETRYNEDGEVEEKYENKYDEEGRLIEELTFLDGDEIAEHKTYERDDTGQVVKAYKHYQDGEKDTIHYKRDDDGRLIEKATIDSFDEEEAREIVEYEKDKVSRRKVYEYDELVLDESYQYDKDGNMVEHTKWSIEEEDARFINTFDTSGKLIKALKENLKGKLLSRVEYRYEGDRLTKVSEEHPYGSNTTTLIYDERGNPIEQVEVDQHGEMNNKALRKYNENNDVVESEVFINFHGRGINQHYLLTYTHEYYD